MTTFIPYESLTVQWNEKRDSFALSLPWITLEVDVDEAEKMWIEKAIDDLGQFVDSAEVQRFLLKFQDYPVAYLAPRSLADFEDESHSIAPLEDGTLISPRAFAVSLVQNKGPSDVALPLAWEWDLSKLLEKTKVDSRGAYDPLSVLTYLAGLRLKEEAKTARFLVENLAQLKSRNEELFFGAMKTLLRQTHYITSSLKASVTPALHMFPEAREDIEEFLREEAHHDVLMVRSLAELGCKNPEDTAVLEEVRLTMACLKQAACTNPLAFVAMIGFFEGSMYGETDPLADLLQSSSKPKAAKGYADHFRINKEHDHSKMALTLGQKLGEQSAGGVAFALRCLEFAMHFRRLSEQRIVDCITMAA